MIPFSRSLKENTHKKAGVSKHARKAGPIDYVVSNNHTAENRMVYLDDWPGCINESIQLLKRLFGIY
jgi:hypothetical protein